MATPLLKQEPDKGSFKAKRLNAALNTKYLERELREFKANQMR